uniref:Uncharacterized protein n=1 Tax=Rhizophora mucronata TaxID=61149 RepID=A0A2P2QA66_RHIMU
MSGNISILVLVHMKGINEPHTYWLKVKTSIST